MSGSTVYRTKRRFVEGNLERALKEEPRPGAERKLTGKCSLQAAQNVEEVSTDTVWGYRTAGENDRLGHGPQAA